MHPLHSVPEGGTDGSEMAEASLSFEAFFEAEHAGLFGALCLVTGNRHEAEEVMQDAFLRLWERWDRVSVMENAGGFLYRTAMNLFRNRYRRAGLAVRRAVNVAPTEDALATIEDRDVVVRALRELSADQRAAVVLTGYVGLTSEEAGRVLGMKPGTVRVLATRARAAMRDKAGDRR